LRQQQIIKEMEQCTGIKIKQITVEDTLREHKEMQYAADREWLADYKNKQKEAEKRGNIRRGLKFSQFRENKEGAGLDPWL
jgi:hypothetical protein